MKDQERDRSLKKKITRREFVRQAAQTGAAVSIAACTGNGSCGGSEKGGHKTASKPMPSSGMPNAPKVLLISIDSLPPHYLTLNTLATGPGKSGDWLMPRVRQFVDDSVLFNNARCYLPSATDMNHLNAIAGTSSAHTGIVGVSMQFFDWREDGAPNIVRPSLSWARDHRGEPVDTLFNAWKRKWPRSRTLYASGKGWVAEMFRTKGSDVDIILTGYDHPGWIPSPAPVKFYDPPSNREDVSVSLATMIYSRTAYEKKPDHFPSDAWLADAALEVLQAEKPDFGVILLAQMDDAQHGLGTISCPGEFERKRSLFAGMIEESRFNSDVWKGPILAAVRDVDIQFGKFVDGIRKMPYYRDATIVLYSDHGHRTHRDTILSNYHESLNTNPRDLLVDAGFLTDREKVGKDLLIYTATSFGMAHFRGKSVGERTARAMEAKRILAAHRVHDRLAGAQVSPWRIIDRAEMEAGVPGMCGPGELFHQSFSNNNRQGSPHWPDLFIFMEDGWQLPITEKMVNNIGTTLPWYLPTTYIFYGGHGAPDTADIVMAFQGPGVSKGKAVRDPDFRRGHRISDIAATVAAMFNLRLGSCFIGRDRSADL
jgi:hypothetical protein